LKIYDHTGIPHFIKAAILTVVIVLFTNSGKAITRFDPVLPGKVTSTQHQAIEYVEKVNELKSSAHWPNIKPDLFLKNLKNNIHNPISIYPGKGTNFCGYGALTYLFLQDDPLGYAILLIQLFIDGKATFRNVVLDPSPAIKQEAGDLKYKGVLDINPAEQMWFLTLADHYKGYLNFFNRDYNEGDENTFWASVNYAKFNRMTRQLLNYNYDAMGADLMRPRLKSLYNYISEKIKTGTVVLFINNRILHKKDHIQVKLAVPTHFVVAEKISIENDMITFIYWDYGRRTQMQVSTAFFKRIVFGITWFTKKETDAK
jgi:hypothetical protein